MEEKKPVGRECRQAKRPSGVTSNQRSFLDGPRRTIGELPMENDVTAAQNTFLAEAVKTWQYRRD
jgi:hypothetical protein